MEGNMQEHGKKSSEHWQETDYMMKVLWKMRISCCTVESLLVVEEDYWV